MKLYTSKFSPNPRRVHIYLVEKGLEDVVEKVWLDLMKGEHLQAEMLAKNPLGKVPVLELDDGRILTESVAICEYLEELYPDPPLIGTDPWQRAQTREALRIGELGPLIGAMTSFQHSNPFFADKLEQHEVVAESGRQKFAEFLTRVDSLLEGRAWLAGDIFTIADISLICAIDFGKVSGCVIPEGLANVERWLVAVRERPSCQIKRKKKPAAS